MGGHPGGGRSEASEVEGESVMEKLEKPYYTFAELAEYLNVTETHLCQLCRRNEAPRRYRDGDSCEIRFIRNDVDLWIEERHFPSGDTIERINEEKRERARQQGLIYILVSPGIPAAKIGYTKAGTDSRISTLQTGNPLPLLVLATFPGTRKTEKEIHRCFRGYETMKFSEWFQLRGAFLDWAKSYVTDDDARAKFDLAFIPIEEAIGIGSSPGYLQHLRSMASTRPSNPAGAPICDLEADYAQLSEWAKNTPIEEMYA